MEVHTSLLGSKRVRGFFNPDELLNEDVEEEEEEPPPPLVSSVHVELLETAERRKVGEERVAYYLQKSDKVEVRPWRDEFPEKPFCPHLKFHNIINWIESFTFTHPREFYDDLFQRQADQQSKTLTNVVINQMKAHKNMMKHSGVTLSTCPDLPIRVGDQVRLKMEAYLRRPQAVRDIHQYNKQITELDGSPSWTDRTFEVMSYDEGTGLYTLNGLYSQNKDGTDYPTPYRKHDICKFSGIKVGDIVRISMTRIKRVRKHLTGPVIGYLNGLKVLHKFTRSLFMVTHIPRQGKTPAGHTPPGYFVDTVFSVGHDLDGKSALYPQLKFETDEDLATPWDQNPHSAAFYDFQMEDLDSIDLKDQFTGFKEQDLLYAGDETQKVFWDEGRDGDPTERYLNLSWKPEIWRGPKQDTRIVRGVTIQQGYEVPYVNNQTWLKPPLARQHRLLDRANSYYRCIQRLREKGRASTARASKRVRYDEEYERDVCIQQARFGKFLTTYAFN